MNDCENIFKINSDIKIKTESIQGHNIYYIDNFYEHPDKVDNFIFDEHTPLWKSAEEPSFNGSHFFDRRLIKKDKRLKEVYLFLSNLCKQKIYDDDYYIITNMTRFNKNIFNDLDGYIQEDGITKFNKVLINNVKKNLSESEKTYNSKPQVNVLGYITKIKLNNLKFVYFYGAQNT